MQSAAEQVLQSIDEILIEQDDHLMMPLTTLNQAVGTIFQKNEKIITKMQDKILRTADKVTTKHLDALDGVYTRVLQGLDTWQFDVQFLLTQLAAKGGFTKAGEPLEAALMKELADAPKLAYEGTLVLAVAEAIPFLNQLIEVLREIRDRLPGTPLRFAAERPALGDTDVVVEDDPTIPIGEDERPMPIWPKV